MFLLPLSVNLKLDEVTPREVHLSITQPDEAPWAAYVLEVEGRDGPEILEPVKAGDVTKVSISSIVVGDTRSFSLKIISYSPTTILLYYDLITPNYYTTI